MTPPSFHAVYFDLDGTLLRSDRSISPQTERTLDRLRQKGIQLGIATGRTHISARPFLERITARAPAILFNGAQIRTWDGLTLFAATLPVSPARKILDLARAHDVFVNCYHGDRIRIESRCATSRASARKDGVTQELVGDLGHVIDQHPPTKLLMIAPIEQMDTFEKLVRHALARSARRLSLVRSEPEYLEALPGGVSKGTALLRAAQALRLSADQIIAFGDGLNDLELLREAGWGVATANGHPRLRAAANQICPSNDDDGVATALGGIFGLSADSL